MGRFLAIVMLSCMTIAKLSFADTKPQQNSGTQPVPAEAGATGVLPELPQPPAGSVLPALPPPPAGRSTVIGGAIGNVDPVRDQFTLKVFGQKKPMKILFDQRTEVYRDGVKTPLVDLRPESHASVETVLDGTAVYALSVHSLSKSPEGDATGQVLSYDSGTGALTVSSVLTNQPIQLKVPAGTPIVRVGQAASISASSGPSDLVKGTLVSVQFNSANDGRGVASRISVIAVPGSSFVFSGNVAFLDLHRDLLVVADPRDGKSYKISFDPASFPNSRELHNGIHVRVTANFDGTRYVATSIKIG